MFSHNGSFKTDSFSRFFYFNFAKSLSDETKPPIAYGETAKHIEEW